MKNIKKLGLGAVILAVFLGLGVAGFNIKFETKPEVANADSVFVDLKINGQNGTVTVAPGTPITLSWTSGGVAFCNTGTTAIAPWASYITKPTSGSETFIPTTRGTYGIHCAISQGTNMIVQDSVAVIFSSPVTDLNASCTVNPNSPTQGQAVTFNAVATGGSGNYIYSWSNACTGFGQSCSNTFSQLGSQTAFLQVVSGGQTKQITCQVNIGQGANQLAVETRPASDILNNSATLNGNLLNLGGDPSASVWFQWGTTTSYGFETPRFTKQNTGPFNAGITNLTPNTVYHFRAVAQNGQGIVYGQDMSFTSGNTLHPAQVQTLPATNIAPASATLNGQLISLGGDNGGQVWFQWGATVGYGNETPKQTQNIPGMFSSTLTGLVPNTTYHYRAAAQTSSGIVYGGNMSFTTTGGTGPVCTNHAYQQCSGNGVYWFNSCGQKQELAFACANNQSCQNNVCVNTPPTCTPNSYQQCVGNNKYWFDSCGNQGSFIGSCITTPTCTPNAYQQCVAGAKYWFDSCGQQGSFIGSCTTAPTCTPNAYQQCVGNSKYWFDSCGQQGTFIGSCTTTPTCTPNSYQSCVGGNKYWFDSCGQQGSLIGSCVTGNQNITVTKQVRNLSAGNLNWASSVGASPYDILQFQITVSAANTSGQYLNAVTVRDMLPSTLVYNDALMIDGMSSSGNIGSGITLSNMTSGQTKTITYQTQVAAPQNFSFGTTTVTNSATATSSGFTSSTGSAQVVVTRGGITGVTVVPTGLTNNFWVDSFFLPLVLALLGVWAYKSGLLNSFGLAGWVNSRKAKFQSSIAQSKLASKIAEIRNREKN